MDDFGIGKAAARREIARKRAGTPVADAFGLAVACLTAAFCFFILTFLAWRGGLLVVRMMGGWWG